MVRLVGVNRLLIVKPPYHLFAETSSEIVEFYFVLVDFPSFYLFGLTFSGLFAMVRPLKMDTVIIDGHNAAYRFYFGCPTNETDPALQCNAVVGWANLLFALRKRHSKLIAVFDAFDKAPRGPDDYKGNRKETPEGIRNQLPVMRGLAEALGIEVHVAQEPKEGDDLMCALAYRESSTSSLVLLHSLDKDIGQLVKGNVCWLRPFPGDGAGVLTNAEDVRMLFGVTPAQIPSYLALSGDAADNVKGVPGIGKVAAVDLLSHFPTVLDFLEAPDEEQDRVLTPRKRNLIKAHGTFLRQTVDQLTLNPFPVEKSPVAQNLVEAKRLLAKVRAGGLAMEITMRPSLWTLHPH